MNVLRSLLLVIALAGVAGCSSSSADGGGYASATLDGAVGPGADGGGRGESSAASCPSCPVLPLEVLGPPHTTVDATVSVADPGKVTALWLLLHEIDSERKASVALNGAAFVDITNQSATVLGTGAGFGGIGGAYHTLAMTLPVPAGALQAGANRLHFRFNGTDGVSLGYRVLAFNFVDAVGARLLPASSFVQDDPATWHAPLPSAQDIAAGEMLWRTAPLVDSPLKAQPLRARCTDCHAQDGRDLKYFNYSNLSIRERSQFHGLTRNEGEQIASYIRSLSAPSPGRVWNPPYQPGPSLASAPPENWSAGAGLDAVVEPETAGGAALPGGLTDPSRLFDGHLIVAIHPQDIPIPMQLIDWNRWLPVVHPLDAMAASGADFAEADNYKLYVALRNNLVGQNGKTKADYLRGRSSGATQLEWDLTKWGDSMTYDLYGRLLPPDAGVVANWTAARFATLYSAGKWNAVKEWELMQEFGLENMQPALYGANGNPRAWFSNRHVFDVSPAIIGRISNDSLLNTVPAEGRPASPIVVNQYLANVWYELQSILNAGSRHRNFGGHHTIDWGYMAGHFGDLDRAAHEGQPMRLALFNVVSMQEHDTSVGPEDPWWGWNLRDESPTNLHLEFPEWATEPNAAAIVQTVYQVWLEKSATFDQAQWKAIQNDAPSSDPNWPHDHLGNMGYDGLDVGNEQWILADFSQGSDAVARSVADVFYSDLDAMKKLGVYPAVIAASASFAKFMWPAPQNDWNRYRTATASETAAPKIQVSAGTESISVTWSGVAGAASYNVKRARPGDAAPLAAAILVRGTSFTDRPRRPGETYAYAVSANFSDGEGQDSSPASTAAASGLVAHWTFDEAQGAVIDSAGLQAPGVLVGGATRIPNGSGSAMAFDGTGYVSFPASVHRWLGATATVALWMRTTQPGTGDKWNTPALMGRSNSVYAGNQMTEYGLLDKQGHLGVLFTDQVDAPVYSGARVNDGAWHHVAMTRDAASGAVQVFVDGALSASGTGGTGVLGERIYSLGKLENAATDTYFIGAMDDVQVYDTVLDPAAIAALFKRGAQ